ILFGVPVKRLNEQVRRNRDRFPSDFMFQFTYRETKLLRSQIATLDGGRGRYSKYRPYAFTEHGALMAANVLNSKRAVQASVFVIRAFIKLRQVLATHKQLAEKLTELEARIGGHDTSLKLLVAAIRRLMQSSTPKTRGRIGFARPKR